MRLSEIQHMMMQGRDHSFRGRLLLSRLLLVVTLLTLIVVVAASVLPPRACAASLLGLFSKDKTQGGSGLGSTGAEVDPMAGYESRAKNDFLELFVNPSDGNVIVKDLKANKLWRSAVDLTGKSILTSSLWKNKMASPAAFVYTDAERRRTRTETTTAGERASVTIESLGEADGCRVTFSMAKLGLTIALEYRLGKDFLEVSIPAGGLKEEGAYLFVSVEPMPFFGAAYHDQQGYLFIPDNSGMITYFKPQHPKYTKGFEQDLYGADAYEFLPVFDRVNQHTPTSPIPVIGLATKKPAEAGGSSTDETRGPGTAMGTTAAGQLPALDTAFVGIVTKGDSEARLIASPAGYVIDYYRTSVLFTVRKTYQMWSSTSGSTMEVTQKGQIPLDRSIRYYLLHGDDASYSGMARRYRQYLMDEMGLARLDSSPGMYLRIFGGAQEHGVLFDEYKVMTTFEQTIDIVDELRASGVDNILLSLVGWNYNGYGETYPRRWPPEKRLGGIDGLRRLAQYAEGNGISLVLEDNYLDAYKGAGGFSTRADTIRGLNKLQLTREGHFLMRPEIALEKYAKKDMKSMAELGIDGVDIDHIGSIALSDASVSDDANRKPFIDTTMKIADTARELMGTVISQGANAYVLGHVDRIREIPVEDSLFAFVDESVPFYEIALHGLIPYSAFPGNLRSDPQKEFLKMIEYGALPSFELTEASSTNLKKTAYNQLFSSEFRLWKDKVVDEYQQVCGEMGDLQVKFIDRHEKLADKVYATIYEDGTEVIVNYGSSPYVKNEIGDEIEGGIEDRIEIGPQSYAVIRRK